MFYNFLCFYDVKYLDMCFTNKLDLTFLVKDEMIKQSVVFLSKKLNDGFSINTNRNEVKSFPDIIGTP